MPVAEQWIFESPLFLSDDARLVRAGMRMLAAAWRSNPAGSLSPSFAYISSVTGLSEREISDHYVALTSGWELRDERLFHVEMSALCDRLARRHGDALAAVAEDAVAACQDPESFELTAGAPEPHRNKGKRALRPNWRPSPETVKELFAKGIETPEDQEYVIQRMRNWAKSEAVRKVDWDATLLNLADRIRHWELPSKKNASPLPLVGASSRFPSLAVNRAEHARANNLGMFESLRQERSGG